MWDGVHNKELTRLLEAFWEEKKPVATCSQGAATLLDARVTSTDGGGLVPLVKGQKVESSSPSSASALNLEHDCHQCNISGYGII